jgi:hypothetical protein
MDLSSVIKTFNETNEPKITLGPTRVGTTIARLPRVAREIIVADSNFDPRFKVRESDIAWLAEEARRAAEPAYALLEAALGALAEVELANKNTTTGGRADD